MAAKSTRKRDKQTAASTLSIIDLKRQLLESVIQCKPNVVKRLMDAKVDPNCTNELGETPLIIACQLEQAEPRQRISSLLLKSDASVNIQDASGNTALSNAVKKVDERLVETLLERGADVSLATADGNTILCCAAISGNYKITKLVLREVLKLKLPVDHKNMHGLTPLLLAAQGGHLDVAKILVKEGRASVTVRDLDNFMTAEQWMKQFGFHTAQEIAFLSPKRRHRKRNGAKTLLDSVMELESESYPDIFGFEQLEKEKQQSPTVSLPHLTLHHQNEAAKSMFDLHSSISLRQPTIKSDLSTTRLTEQLIPGVRTKHNVFSSSYLNKRNSIVGQNKKSKFYAKGSLEPLPDLPPPPALNRMDSIVDTRAHNEEMVTRDNIKGTNSNTKSSARLPPLKK